MSVLKYLNDCIDDAVRSAGRLDFFNRENVQRIVDAQSKVDDLNTEIKDLEDILAIGLSEELTLEFEERLKGLRQMIVSYELDVKNAKQRKLNDDSKRLYYINRANALRATRDKYKESL